jgi:hypothetical protein
LFVANLSETTNPISDTMDAEKLARQEERREARKVVLLNRFLFDRCR